MERINIVQKLSDVIYESHIIIIMANLTWQCCIYFNFCSNDALKNNELNNIMLYAVIQGWATISVRHIASLLVSYGPDFGQKAQFKLKNCPLLAGCGLQAKC
jgi:hypothetical protein